MGFRTVRANCQAVLWTRNGEGKLIEGPSWVYVGLFSNLEVLRCYAANEHEYLIIEYLDGHRENRTGPCTLYNNPLLYRSISVKSAIDLDANELLVVYRKRDSEGRVDRHLIYGPALHVPHSDEWTHEFVWHGSENGNKTRKVPGATRFTKLRTIPDQFYYNVGEVRTNDEAVLTVKLMIFFELKDVVRMLESSHDPVADFINAASADVISWSSQRSYEEFLEQAKALNELESFPQLTTRAKGIGYNVTKVVFRGYQASTELQNMNNDSITSRTKLRLQLETEEQAQHLLNLKLQKEQERSKQRQEMEQAENQHKLEIEKYQHNENLRQKQAEEAQKMELQKAQHDLLLLQRRAEDELVIKKQQEQFALEAKRQRELDEQKQQHLAALKQMGVDLTKFLVAQFQNPDKVIRIDGRAQNDEHPNIHVHS